MFACVVKNNQVFVHNFQIFFQNTHVVVVGFFASVGPSGTGKTTLLDQLGGSNTKPKWKKDEAIISHFDEISYEKTIELFSYVGLNAVPSWIKPFHVLSNGEKHRASTARIIKGSNFGTVERHHFLLFLLTLDSKPKEPCILDEFGVNLTELWPKRFQQHYQKWYDEKNAKKNLYLGSGSPHQTPILFHT